MTDHGGRPARDREAARDRGDRGRGAERGPELPLRPDLPDGPALSDRPGDRPGHAPGDEADDATDDRRDDDFAERAVDRADSRYGHGPDGSAGLGHDPLGDRHGDSLITPSADPHDREPDVWDAPDELSVLGRDEAPEVPRAVQELLGVAEPGSDFPRDAFDEEPEAREPIADADAALAETEAELNRRWPETKLEPSTTRITALVDVLGAPHRGYPVVHVAGTNGKTSVTRMVDALLSRLGLRTGRFTSPHLQSVTERICLDNEPIDARRYVEVYRDVAPYVELVDSKSDIPLSKFEVLTGMAFAAFADAPVEAAVVEVGMGGAWDATNVVDAAVAVVTPIGIDHVEYLGHDILGIAAEKAGIVKPGSIAVLAEQTPDVARVLIERCVAVDATVAREGMEFGVLARTSAVGGQQLRLQGLGGVYDEIYLPLFGEHQARNAATALAAVEAFFGAGGSRRLDVDAVRDAFASVASPGRLERLRSTPSVFADAAHNVHGARALATALRDEFTFRRLVAVVATMAEKDSRGILGELEPVVDEVVITRNSSPRAKDLDELAAEAVEVFGADRVDVASRLDEAVESAIQAAEEIGDDDQFAGAAVVITGSVVTAGEARALFGKAAT